MRIANLNLHFLFADRRKSKRHLSWLRNSMRKTKPIELPEQEQPPLPAAYTNDAFESELNPVSTDDSTTDSFSSFNTVYFDASSCGANAAAQEQSPAEILRQDDIINVILNTSSAESGTSRDESPRPRQLGRRSETRPRVVSIDVSSTPEHNIRGTRPVSAPSQQARVHLELPRAPSEDSSLGGSSRNASPVSLVSSGASSSAASTVENNNQR